MPRLTTALVVFALCVAAGSGLAAAQSDEMKRDEQEVLNYRLNMDVLQRVGEAYKSIMAFMAADPRFQKLEKLKAELATLQQKDEPAEADDARMEELEEQINRLEETTEESMPLGDAKTLSDMARNIEAHPQFASAVKKAGFTPREFATAQLALLQAGMAAGLMQAGDVKELPKGVLGENVKFIIEHQKEFGAMTAEWQAKKKP